MPTELHINVVTVWIFCVCNVPNKKKEKWCESSILRYNLIISKQGIL